MNAQKTIEILKQAAGQLHTAINHATLALQRIESQIDTLDREDLRTRNKVRYCRLKEDVEAYIEYHHDGKNRTQKFEKGTLIDCSVATGHVYLDDDGDGTIFFPPALLEEIEVDMFDETIDYNKIVHQG